MSTVLLLQPAIGSNDPGVWPLPDEYRNVRYDILTIKLSVIKTVQLQTPGTIVKHLVYV